MQSRRGVIFLLDFTSPRAVFLIAGLGVLLVLIPIMLVLRREAPNAPTP